MNFAETILLGSIAGFTISLGLPIGKVKGMSKKNPHISFNDFSWYLTITIL